MILEILKLVGSGVIGGFVGSCGTHWFTTRRERQARRRRGFVFFSELRAKAASDIPSGSYWEFHQQQIPPIMAAAAHLHDIFSDKQRAEFDRMVSEATGFRWAPTDTQHDAERKKQFVAAIDDLLNFFTNHD